MKVCLVGSSGGHLTHLYMLKPFWENKERFWVTFDKEDARSLLKDEKMYPCYFPTNRNFKNLIRNSFVAIKVLIKEKPDLIISSGAAVSVPFFYLGKLLGAKLIYIEVFDRVDHSTVSITDNLVAVLLVQKTKITEVFSCTNCADELFVQTVAYNCGFRDKVYHPQDNMSENVRFIDWTRGKNGNPYTFRKQDKALLCANKNLFARKFSENVDRDIVQYVYEKIQKENIKI